MKSRINFRRILGIIFIISLIIILISPDILEARKGSFGGRSFGGFRSKTFKAPKFQSRTVPKSSFGRRSIPTTRPSFSNPSQRAISSFGGKRLNSAKDYTSKYGVPRKTTTQKFTHNGVPQNYIIHSYGGYGSGLLTGYLMGTTSWLWMTPFHPAFYYSRPYYVENPDGTVSVYPPTFSYSKLIFTIIIFAVIIYIIRVIIKSRKAATIHSSFS